METYNPQDHQLKIGALISVSLFGITFVFSAISLFLTHQAQNKVYLKLFFLQILLISFLECCSGMLMFFNTSLHSVKIYFFQRSINSFTLVFSFSLILTIAYAWKVASWKIKDLTYSQLNSLQTKRIVYITLISTLFVIELVANLALLAYLISTGKTSEMILNIFDFVLEISIVAACVIQIV